MMLGRYKALRRQDRASIARSLLVNVLLGSSMLAAYFTRVVVCAAAALWWLPTYFWGEPSMPWQAGALALAGLWMWTFNHWPQFGTRRLYPDYWLLPELVANGLGCVVFLLGFVLT